MPSAVHDFVFSEPSGRTHAAVMAVGSIVFLGLYVYAAVLRGGTSGGWLLVMAVGTALSGVAESLPDGRRRTAGTLRVAAILVLLGLLATTVLAPEFLVGP